MELLQNGQLQSSKESDLILNHRGTSTIDQTRLLVYEMSTIISLPLALRAIIRLGVPEILAKREKLIGANIDQGMNAKEILKHISVVKYNEVGHLNLERLLRALASRGFLEEIVIEKDGHSDRRYKLTPSGKYLAPDEEGVCLGPLICMNTNPIFMKSWLYLEDAILDGVSPFKKAHGKSAFEMGAEDPRLDNLFNVAMANHSRLFMKLVLKEYGGFSTLKSLVDVGGGFGASLHSIIKKYPTINGINFDQPHVVSKAPHMAGVQNIGGDMFESVPKGDAMFMKWILHDWDDEHCERILKNCYQALPDDGKIIIVDAILPETISNACPRARQALTVDLLMLAYNSGGRERTLRELQKLVTKAGFSRMEVVATIDSTSVVEVYK